MNRGVIYSFLLATLQFFNSLNQRLWVRWDLATKPETVFKGSILRSSEDHLEDFLTESQCKPFFFIIINIYLCVLVSLIKYASVFFYLNSFYFQQQQQQINKPWSVLWKLGINHSSLPFVMFYVAQCFAKETFSLWPPSGVTHKGKLGLWEICRAPCNISGKNERLIPTGAPGFTNKGLIHSFITAWSEGVKILRNLCH